jgi:hypothetical protein
MRYLCLIRSNENAQLGPPPAALFDAIAKLGAEASAAGVLLETGGLAPTAAGARVRLADGRLTVSDGPFTDEQEQVGAWAIYDVTSMAEVVDWSSRFLKVHRDNWPGWEGECQIRRVYGPEDFG